MPFLKKSSSMDPIVCDITTIEEHLDREAIGATEFSDIAGLKELAFVGRSNVGKSSLINKVLGVQMTQTSKTPGKTKDLISKHLFKVTLKHFFFHLRE